MIDAAMEGRRAVFVQVFADQIAIDEPMIDTMLYDDFARIAACPARGLIRVYVKDYEWECLPFGWRAWDVNDALRMARERAPKVRGDAWPRWLVAAYRMLAKGKTEHLALKDGALVDLPSAFTGPVISTMGP